MAQWLERWTGDPKVEGLNPVRSTRKTLRFSSQKGCVDSLSLCPTPVCMRTHTKDHVCYVKDPVVHVRVWWIYENTKITSMHLYPRRWNVAAPSGGGIKNGHIRYTTSYGGTQKNKDWFLEEQRLGRGGVMNFVIVLSDFFSIFFSFSRVGRILNLAGVRMLGVSCSWTKQTNKQ